MICFSVQDLNVILSDFLVPKVPTTATSSDDEDAKRASRRTQRSGTTDGTSDDDASVTDENTNKSLLNGSHLKPTKSRIDKWKAKHEAMLKQAESAKEIGKVEDEDEEEDEKPVSTTTTDDKEEDKPSSPSSHHDEVELPNIEPNGVCINFGDDKKSSKPHTRQVQQALSV